MGQGLGNYDLRESTRAGVSYIPGLDGLRALSVLVVMLSHYGFGKIIPGGLGVTVFFFISGMLITTLLLVEGDTTGRVRFGNFYMRRLMRLMPELLVFVGLTAALAAWLGEPVAKLKITAAILYFYNYYMLLLETPHSGAVIWPHLWSLAVEEHFYLTFPIALMLLVKRMRGLVKLLLAVLILSLAWRFAVIALGFPTEYGYRASETRIDSIAYGCLFAILVRYSDRGMMLVRRHAGALFAGGAALLLLTLALRGYEFRETIRYSLQGIALSGLFAGLYFWSGAKPLLAFLELPAMRWVGRVSYGAYLWHFVPHHLYGLRSGLWYPETLPMAQRILYALAMTAGTLLLAALSYHLVFRRFATLRRRFGSHTTT